MKKRSIFFITTILPILLILLLLLLFHMQLSWIKSIFKQQVATLQSQILDKSLQVSLLVEDESSKIIEVDISTLTPGVTEDTKTQESVSVNNILSLKAVNKDTSAVKSTIKIILINAIFGVMILCLLASGLVSILVYMYKIRKFTKYQMEFIATITHDLKTPLAVISAAAENMMEGIIQKKEKIKSYGELLKKESSRLSSTINFFLMYSHLQSTEHLNKTVCNICELIRNEVERMEPLLIKKEFEVVVKFQKEDIFIECDSNAINSLL